MGVGMVSVTSGVHFIALYRHCQGSTITHWYGTFDSFSVQTSSHVRQQNVRRMYYWVERDNEGRQRGAHININSFATFSLGPLHTCARCAPVPTQQNGL